MSFRRMLITCKGKKKSCSEETREHLDWVKKPPYLDLASMVPGGRSQSQKAPCCVIPLK